MTTSLLGASSPVPVPMDDIYDAMVIAVARIGRSAPAVDRALREAIPHVANAIPHLEHPSSSPDASVATHLAHVTVLALAQHLLATGETGRDIGPAYAAVLAVLEALHPHVSPADQLLRSVLLEGEPLDAAARRLWCA